MRNCIIFIITILSLQIQSCHIKSDSTFKENEAFINFKALDSLTSKNPSLALKRIEHILLNENEIADSLIIRTLLIKGEILSMKGFNDSALHIFNYAKEKSNDLDLQKLFLQAKLAIGETTYKRGAYDEALRIFTKIQHLSKELNLTHENIRANYFIGKYYHTTGNFDRAMIYYNNSVKKLPENNISPLKSYIKLSIGKCYLNKGDTNNALLYYQEAFRISQLTGNRIIIGHSLNHLGNIYKILGQHELAKSYHFQALQIRETLGYPSDMAISFNNLGLTYLEINKSDSALYYFKRSLETSLLADYKKGTVKALTNLARVEDRDDTGLFLDALKIAEKTGYNAGIANSRFYLGQSFLLRKAYDKAIHNFQESIIRAKNSKLSETIPEIHYGLYQSYLGIDDTSKALYHLQEYSILKENWLKEKNQQQLAEMFILFEAEEMDRNNQMLKADNAIKEMTIKRKKLIIVIVGASLLIFILLSLFIYWRFDHNRKAHQKQLKLNQQLEIANREKDKLMSIISHELRNPLFWFQNLTKSLSKKYRELPYETTEKSLLALDESATNAYHLMDNLLFWSRSKLNRITPKIESTNLAKLIDQNTKLFSSILNQRNIVLINNIPHQTTIKTDPQLIGCVFRNLISNAIKFTNLNGMITIDAEETNDWLEIHVTDNGKGIEVSLQETLFHPNCHCTTLGIMNEQGSGFGLKLCKEFIELCKGEIYLDKNYKNGTRICIILPNKNNNIHKKPINKVTELELC